MSITSSESYGNLLQKIIEAPPQAPGRGIGWLLVMDLALDV